MTCMDPALGRIEQMWNTRLWDKLWKEMKRAIETDLHFVNASLVLPLQIRSKVAQTRKLGKESFRSGQIGESFELLCRKKRVFDRASGRLCHSAVHRFAVADVCAWRRRDVTSRVLWRHEQASKWRLSVTELGTSHVEKVSQNIKFTFSKLLSFVQFLKNYAEPKKHRIFVQRKVLRFLKRISKWMNIWERISGF